MSARLIGRESELADLSRFLAEEEHAAAILTGEAGAGKTSLLEASLDLAREHGSRVLIARPGENETGFSFAALRDLLDGIDISPLAVPPPQRHALEVVLLRADPGANPPEPHLFSTAFLGVVRALSDEKPLLIAIDDVHWMDASSADALLFVSRRVGGRRIRFILTRRPVEQSPLELSLERGGLLRIDVTPLSIGAARSLLLERLNLSPSRRVLRRLFETTGGNPFFLLELGRTLVATAESQWSDVQLTPALDQLFGARIAALPTDQRRLLLLVSLAGHLTRSELGHLAAHASDVDVAIAEGLLISDHETMRPAHPLLAAAARINSGARERAERHGELAEAIVDEERSVRHRGLSINHPDAAVADALSAAAARASARGAARDAAELHEIALRLTPPDDPRLPDRIVALATSLHIVDRLVDANELLTERIGDLPSAKHRARAYILLADASTTVHEHGQYLELASQEAVDEELGAIILSRKVLLSLVIGLANARQAAADAERAYRAAGTSPDPLVPFALAWARILRGMPIDDVIRQIEGTPMINSLERVAAIRLAFRGDLQARRMFLEQLSDTEARGEVGSVSSLQLQLLEVEVRAGNVRAATRILEELEPQWTNDVIPSRCRALVSALIGSPEEAQVHAGDAISRSERRGVMWEWLEAMRARGIAALFARELDVAVESLLAVWHHTEREGIDDPGAFPVAPDLVEALVELGRIDAAAGVTDRLRRLSDEQHHPWGLASVKRCEALLALGSGDWNDEPAALMSSAADDYGTLGLRFDQARCLLLLGRAQRRAKKRAQARAALDDAIAVFDAIGATGWAQAAKDERARIAARTPRSDGTLTDAEDRVARLAAEGRSNKEIARDLFITVHTVEKHLSSAYAKLGVRSRAQLTQHFTSSTP